MNIENRHTMNDLPSSRDQSRLGGPALLSLLLAAGLVGLVLWMSGDEAKPKSASTTEGEQASSAAPVDESSGARPLSSVVASSRPRLADDNAQGEPTLEGVVVDEAGAPITQATIRLALIGATAPRMSAAVSDEDGAFAAQLQPGEWRIAATAAGYRPQIVKVEVPTSVRLVLKKDAGFEVKVTDNSGLALAGVHVALRARSHLLPGQRRGATGEDGTLLLRGIAVTGSEWRGRLEVRHGDYLPKNLSITATDVDTGNLTVVLGKGGEFKGRIIDETGAPVGGALITLKKDGAEPQRLKSVSSGEFHFRQVETGTYRLAVTSLDQGYALRDNLVVGESSADETTDIRLQLGTGKIVGSVKNAAGGPVARCRVRVVPAAGEGKEAIAFERVTDADGSFAFSGLPDGFYDVFAGGVRYSRDVVRQIGTNAALAELTVDLPGSLSGRVLADVPDGYSIQLKRHTEGASAPQVRAVRFPPQRTEFQVRRLPAGRYEVTLLVGAAIIATLTDVEVKPSEETSGIVLAQR